MTCPVCRQGELKPGLADKVMSQDGMTLVVTGVPASVCETCGERYFEADVTQRLLDLARERSERRRRGRCTALRRRLTVGPEYLF